MKKHSKITTAFLIALILVLAFPITAAAASTTPTIKITTDIVQPLTVPVGQTTTIKVTSDYAKPITWSVTATVGTAWLGTSSPPAATVKTLAPHSTTLTVNSATAGAQTIRLTATDSSNKRIKATKDIVITYTSVSSGRVYVALGDSIPYGFYNTSLLNYLVGGTNSYSYIEQLRDKLSILPANYYDKSVSGNNTVDVLNQLNDPVADAGIRALIAKADVITLCVGANDIMDAAPRTANGLDKYNINWALADQGRDNFEAYWIDIIDEIEKLNYDATLIVMTIYNPYRSNDSFYGRVNPYFEEDEDTVDKEYGLNYIIRNTATLYDTTSQSIDTLNYRVADVYNAFNASTDKDSLTSFYKSFCDPHPNQLGQDLLFKTHYEALTAI